MREQSLRISPNFVLASTTDGRPFIAKDVEPYTQFWLSERERALLSLFGGRTGSTQANAIDAYSRLGGKRLSAAMRKKLAVTIGEMQAAGVLIGTKAEVSRYDLAMADAYLQHRPFPGEIARFIAKTGKLKRDTRVLDLAGGPGDLATQLAAKSDNVTLMELSRGFIQAAQTNAKRRKVRLNTVHESCNRLDQLGEHFDVVTVAQALHWLDDVKVCKGLYRLLPPGGHFFVIHSAIDVGDDHPLAYLIGRRSILGSKPDLSFKDEAAALGHRLALLFEALDDRHVQRIDRTQSGSANAQIALRETSLFRLKRDFDANFLTAFLTPAHAQITGRSMQELLDEARAKCKSSKRPLGGHMNWAVLHFSR